MNGVVDPAWRMREELAPVAEAFAAQLAADPGYSAQVCAYVDGEPVLDLWGGDGLGEESLICLFSVSKGFTGICFGMLVERGLLELDRAVADYWPEFAQAEKGAVTVRQLLSHQAGLPEIDGGLTWHELADDRVGAARLAAQRPMWRPGSAWGYHAITIGVLGNELFRRVTGESIQAFYEREVRAPRGIDAYLGLPEELEPRVAPVIVPEFDLPDGPAQIIDEIGRAFLRDPGLAYFANSRESHAVGMPAAGGVGSARGIARLYASVAADLGGPRLLSDDTVSRFGQIHSSGIDVSSGVGGRFGLLFQKPWHGRPFASHRAIGHDGAAGSLGFHDPASGLAFGFTSNRPAPEGGERRADELARMLSSMV